MPIEIHCSSDIDEHGEERARPKVTPHPIVRPHDCCYISQPEHLEGLLHLQVFRTSASAAPSDGRPLFDQEEEGGQEDSASSRATQVTLDKKLLGKELLNSQATARLLLLEGKKKRRKASGVTVTAAPAPCRVSAEEVRRQERDLLRVLAAIKCPREDRERQAAQEQVMPYTCAVCAVCVWEVLMP
jgi:hypothetical protein